MTEIKVFTDGSCMKSSKYCGYGIHYPNGELKDVGEKFTIEPLTNQRAELYAIYKALSDISTYKKTININLYTDSEYSINSLTKWIKKWKLNNWINSQGKPVKNKDILEKIDEIINNHNGKIKFNHVYSHTKKLDYDSIHNDIADKLAKSKK